ncbi:MAG: tetratricopeptide repeat protein [Pseudobdellovibrionaceae bacterium]
MKKLFLLLIASSLVLPITSQAQRSDQLKQQGRKRQPAFSMGQDSNLRNQLSNALRMAQGGQYESAANNLFSLSRRTELAEDRPQIKYILGTLLIELKLYQTAAFQFVDVIRSNHPKYAKLAIEKLSVAADTLGDDTILNYAISRVDLNGFPSNLRDMIYFRLGEIKLHNREFDKAAELFGQVGLGTSYYFQALFNKGLAELEAKKPAVAIATFQKMLDGRARAPVTDTNKVAAQMALARALYQKQDWEASIEAYSKVPRDTVMWHDAIFEQSWAMLRAARFRSVLSNFQTLHSSYYEDFYMPESLLLRAIVYLYICKYDEMEKVLSLFEKTYGPVRTSMGDFVKTNNDPGSFYAELEKAQMIKAGKNANLRLPYLVLRNVLDQGDVKRSLQYVDKLKLERNRIEASSSFKNSSLGQYALKILSNRNRNAKLAIGDMMKAHLLNMRIELRDLYEQAGFIRYEMITGRKESIKKKIAGKDIGPEQIDEKVDRQFYIQNGYEYYPFKGEYWLDEVGNYHYLGKQSCE